MALRASPAGSSSLVRCAQCSLNYWVEECSSPQVGYAKSNDPFPRLSRPRLVECNCSVAVIGGNLKPMPPGSETNAIRRRLGKWSEPGIPHKGWTCISDEDLGSDNMQTCEMCESSEIRYAHAMTHPDYKGQLIVGVVCAGHMEQDVERARNRERLLRSRSSRRERWPHSNWKISYAGNEYRNHAGYNCVVKQWPQGWQLLMHQLPDGDWIRGRKRFATAEEAKLAAFDYIERNPRHFDDE